ncbi:MULTISPECIES: glycosyltransferase family 2 protein [Romboutsia]|jgi:GT2 family glycosyltransferase|uniref:glycosyltransferase family 2 protein n=1 Tax=Romboutsia TaxID=1501226 RepID=UPI00217038FE|nr:MULTISPECIES: glycosyltransferase family 2 protein [Romboutsia]MCI9061376.1 glycosyltransferase family 2 protein [Romboutsia sp.]
MNKITFVILHYETVDDTRLCLKSLEKFLTNEGVSVVVVDNGSKNGRLHDLEEEYKDYKSVIFLRSDLNLGFAKGNNIGFKYAKQYLDPDFIILTNSDTVYEQEDFIEVLESSYKSKRFDVAGPKIISMADGKNQNPVIKIYNSKKDVEKRLLKFKILMMFSYLNCDTKLKNYFSKDIIEVDADKVTDDIQLHGACLIFSKEYIEKYDGLYDKTFMYGEESILKHIVDKNNMSMVYIDELVMYHKEGSSTDAIFGKGVRKRQFFYKWNIDGCYHLKKLMEEK